MYGTTMLECCEVPEALLVMAALPVCDMPQTAEGSLSGPPVDSLRCDAACDLQCVFPMRCAAIMDCDEALDLMEEVGDVVF